MLPRLLKDLVIKAGNKTSDDHRGVVGAEAEPFNG